MLKNIICFSLIILLYSCDNSSQTSSIKIVGQMRDVMWKGDLIGFFSRHHKAVFTHHDTFFHAHFIANNRQVLGHIDEIYFNSSSVNLKVSK